MVCLSTWPEPQSYQTRVIPGDLPLQSNSIYPFYKWGGIATLGIIKWNLHHTSELRWSSCPSILGLSRIESTLRMGACWKKDLVFLAVSHEKELLQHRAERRENNQKPAWHENCSLRQGGGGETLSVFLAGHAYSRPRRWGVLVTWRSGVGWVHDGVSCGSDLIDSFCSY